MTPSFKFPAVLGTAMIRASQSVPRLSRSSQCAARPRGARADRTAYKFSNMNVILSIGGPQGRMANEGLPHRVYLAPVSAPGRAERCHIAH
eukprot:6077889-Pleurochrysis_carterae.AAC.1